MAIKTYKVNDFWLDIEKKNHVDIESTDGVITSVKNNGEDIGGGGSSDFSTAKVTIVNSSNLPTKLYFPYINPEFNDIEVSNAGYMGTHTCTVPLYMNGATMSFDEMPAGINITGDAEIDEGLVVITGDCTITIS